MTGYTRSMNVQSKISTFESLRSDSNVEKNELDSSFQDRVGSRSRKINIGKSSSTLTNRRSSKERCEVEKSTTSANNSFDGGTKSFPSSTVESSPSITTVASQNRISRLQKKSAELPTSSTPSKLRSSSQVPEPKVEPVSANASTNYRHIRSSSFQRKLLGFDEDSVEPSKAETKVNAKTERPSSVDSTKESTSLSSQSYRSQRSGSPLVVRSLDIDSRKQRLDVAPNTMPKNIYKKTSSVTPKINRQPQPLAPREVVAPIGKSPIPSAAQTNISQRYSHHSQQKNHVRGPMNASSSFSPLRKSLSSSAIDPVTANHTPATASVTSTSREKRGSLSSRASAHHASSESSIYESISEAKKADSLAPPSPSTSMTKTIASNRAFHAGLARRRQKNSIDNIESPSAGSYRSPEKDRQISNQSRPPASNSQLQTQASETPTIRKEYNRNEIHRRSRSLNSQAQVHTGTAGLSDQSLESEKVLPHRNQRLNLQNKPHSPTKGDHIASIDPGVSINQQSSQPSVHQKPESQQQPSTMARVNKQQFLGAPAQESQFSRISQGHPSDQSGMALQGTNQFPNLQGRTSPLSHNQLPTMGSNSLLPYQNGRQSPSSQPLNFSAQIIPHAPTNHSYPGAVAKYPVPASPSQNMPRSLASSPPLLQSGMARYQASSSQTQPMVTRSPISHGSSSLSPAGIPVTGRRSFSPQDPGGAPQMSYHDDEITLTSVGQIVGTSMDRKSPDLRQRGSGLAENAGFVHSSSTASDSNANPSPLRRHMPTHEERQSENNRTRRLRVVQTSSSDYETDTIDSRDEGRSALLAEAALKEPNMSTLSASQMTSDMAAFFNRERVPVDDETYDYGDREDDSQGSLSYAQRRQKEQREKSARQAAVAAAKAEMEGPFMKTDDVDHYRKTLDTPLSRTALGVATAATVGCVLLGPVGLLVGAAAVGIGVGYMQIPEEQRQNMNNKATEALRNAQESTFIASEKLSNSCVTTYKYSGISDHVPSEVQTCCSGLASLEKDEREKSAENPDTVVNNANGDDKGESNGTRLNNHDFRNFSPSHLGGGRVRDKRGKVACLREGKFLYTLISFIATEWLG